MASPEQSTPAGAPRDALDDIAAYYSGKLRAFGTTPRGVDWNSAESQHVRFEQFCRLFDGRSAFSVNDLGCGYGAFYDFLLARGVTPDYAGYDVSTDMVQAARSRSRERGAPAFEVAGKPSRVADFSVASGIFSVKLSTPDAEWLTYIDRTIDELHRASRLGFAFNCLTSYSDVARRRDDLYYGDPEKFFARCMERFSRQTALLHDYGLFEFTILVRKDPQIRTP